jgi:hypothetical protein
MEMVAKFKALGRPTPDLVTVTYEATALYMQMGYFQWTRRPQLTVLHVALGTLNAGGAWDEALRANAGLVVMAGVPGQTTKGELGYSPRGGIQYLQEVHNQADIVRPFDRERSLAQFSRPPAPPWAPLLLRVASAFAHFCSAAEVVAGPIPCTMMTVSPSFAPSK